MSRDSLHGPDPQDPGTSGDRFPDDRPPGDRLPEATVSRLPVYLRVLAGMAEVGGAFVQHFERARRQTFRKARPQGLRGDAGAAVHESASLVSFT